MTKKPTLPLILFRHLWPLMQNGQREFIFAHTDLELNATAYQVSKAVRRFNESGHKLRWPGFEFSAYIEDAYRVRICAKTKPEPTEGGLFK